MKKYLLVLALGVGVVESRGAAVTAEANDDNEFSASAGGSLALNNVVRVGTFTVSDALLQEHSLDVNYLNSNFLEFGRARIGDGGTTAGRFSKAIDNLNSNAQGFANKQIYLWAFNSTDTSDQNFLSTAIDQGIFYLDMTTQSGPNDPPKQWRFRDTNEFPNTSSIELTDLTAADPGVLATGAHIVIGSFTAGAPDFQLAQIPEPGSLAIAVAGVVWLSSRRRRLV